MAWEWILSVVTALGSILGSAYAVRAIIRHELVLCDKRMEAFREGLDYSEKKH